MTLLRSERTRIHLVTVLEEMPVQETIDGIAELREASLPVGGIVVNMVRPQDLGALERQDLIAGSVDRGRLAATLEKVGIEAGDTLVDGLVAEGRHHAERRGLEDSQRRLVEETDVPSYELPQPARGRRPRRPLRARRRADRGGTGMSPTHRSSRSSARIGPLAAAHDPRELLDVDALLDDRSRGIIVCCGSGGVGKTTTSAALALRAAERGRKVVVLTIDPARRLAQSMGIEALDNTPRPVPDVDPANGGSLDAMMLDMKRTFDEVVQSQASPEKAAQILANPFYVAVSSSFAGTQEYMAMEKLGQLDQDARKTGRWDLIVVDTPPSRSALDFLDAPERLSSFLDGRFMKLLLVPARGPARLMTAGFGLVTNAITKIIGAQVLQDMKAFVAAFDTLFGGFRQRAQRTFELLQDRRTAFLVVAAPEPDALREAAYFVDRLNQEHMPLAGLVVNRASTLPAGELTANAARWPVPSGCAPTVTTTGSPPGCCDCTPTARSWWSARRASPAASRRAIPTYRPRCCRPCRPTCTTSRACVASVTCWRPRWTARQVAEATRRLSADRFPAYDPRSPFPGD